MCCTTHRRDADAGWEVFLPQRQEVDTNECNQHTSDENGDRGMGHVPQIAEIDQPNDLRNAKQLFIHADTVLLMRRKHAMDRQHT